MKKIVAILLAVVFVLGSFAGCASNDNVESGKTITVTDMAGNTVELPTNIDNIACQSSTCEAAIITLGKGALLIGTTDYTDETTFAYQLYPELSTVRKCEDDLSVEEMLEANVDVVFVKDTNKIEKYQNAGMKVVCLDFDTVEGTKKSIELLGTILDVTERSNKCLAYIEKCETLIAERLNDGETKSFTAYYSRAKYEDSNLLTTYAAGHIYSEWIATSGGSVITKDMDLHETKGGVHINGEELVNANPDIIFVGGYYRNSVYEEAMSGEYRDTLTAIKDNRVYVIPTSVSDWSVGTCEIGLVTLWCATVVYPELFSDIDMAKEIITFYKDVADVTVSRELAEAILTSNESK